MSQEAKRQSSRDEIAEKLAEAQTDLQVISLLSGALTRATQMNGCLRAARDHLLEGFGFQYVASYLRSTDDLAFRFEGEAGTPDDALREMLQTVKFEALGPIVEEALAKKCAVIAPVNRNGAEGTSGSSPFLALPLVNEGEVDACLVFFGGEGKGASPERLRTFETLGQITAEAMAAHRRIEQNLKHQQQLQERVGILLSFVKQAANGNLAIEIPMSGNDTLGDIEAALHSLFANLRKSLGQIIETSEIVSASAEELMKISQTMATSSAETATQANIVTQAGALVSSNVTVVASSSEEMISSIKDISRSAEDAARMARAAVDVATRTNQTIDKLGQSSSEIGKVIKVITSIAQQTNLLALNATIEAARAGAAGRGFAVVANEVKELAKETAHATEEISQKIETIQQDTGSAVSAIVQVLDIIQKINDYSGAIATAVEQQTATTNEIGRNLSEAARGTSEIAQNIEGVAEAAHTTSHGASDVQVAAGAVRELASNLRQLVAGFRV